MSHVHALPGRLQIYFSDGVLRALRIQNDSHYRRRAAPLVAAAPDGELRDVTSASPAVNPASLRAGADAKD